MATLAHHRQVLIDLMDDELPTLEPPSFLSVVPGLDSAWKPDVLIIGDALSSWDTHELLARGCELQLTSTLAEGLRAMMDFQFDVVVVQPSVDAEGDGVRFVRAIKARASGDAHSAVFLAQRYRDVPFVILPLTGDSEFAVFRSGTSWSLEHARKTSVADAILQSRHPERS